MSAMKQLFELLEDRDVRDYAARPGTRHPARLIHITRLHDLHRSAPSPGWCVRFLRAGKWMRRCRGFTDSECGGWAESLTAAYAFTQEQEKKLGNRLQRASNTGVQGLSKTVVQRGTYRYPAVVHNCTPRFVVYYGKNRTYEQALKIAKERLADV